MPAVPTCTCLLEGALSIAGRRHRQQFRQQDEAFEDTIHSDSNSERDSSSLSSLSSLSSTSSLSSGSSAGRGNGDIMDMEVIEMRGEVFLVDYEDDEDDYLEIHHLRQLRGYIDHILHTRVLHPNNVHKFSQLHLVLVLYKADDIKCFCRNLRVLPDTFDAILTRISTHTVFISTGNTPQIPVVDQLAIALFQFGHYGNAASVESIAQWAGVSTGLVVKSTHHVIVAASDLHNEVMRWAGKEEKEEAKRWVEAASCSRWRDGYAMVDGTLIPLADKPAFHGKAYFDRKSNYSLNLQVINLPNLRIIDYVLGHTGSTHDSTAFQHSRAYREHAELFQEGEWIWADSAYPAETWCVTPFKRPAADLRDNKTFNYWVSRVRIHSEHAMGFLKGCFQSLHGLRQQIKDERDHQLTLEWVRTCIILHTLVHDIENSGNYGDPDFNEELIELGMDEEDDQDQALHEQEHPARETAGQTWRRKLKQQLFASGITCRAV